MPQNTLKYFNILFEIPQNLSETSLNYVLSQNTIKYFKILQNTSKKTKKPKFLKYHVKYLKIP
jgi:hypothetical protein